MPSKSDDNPSIIPMARPVNLWVNRMNETIASQAFMDAFDAHWPYAAPKIKKKTPNGRTLDHLTKMDPESDRYSYYHATKGWRTRRLFSRDDKGRATLRRLPG